jgi:hypothetical protein
VLVLLVAVLLFGGPLRALSQVWDSLGIAPGWGHQVPWALGLERNVEGRLREVLQRFDLACGSAFHSSRQ